MSVLRDQAEREQWQAAHRERHKKAKVSYLWPMRTGTLTTAQGERSNPVRGYHPGVDIAARRGTPIYAAARGVVSVVRSHGVGTAYGRRVFVDHPDGCQTRYSHLDSIDVEKFQPVHEGEQIGTVGNTGMSTGPHLDYEILDAQSTSHEAQLIGYDHFIDPIIHHRELPDWMALGAGVARYDGHVYNITEIDLRETGLYDTERIGPHRA